jgi:signal transduction histidine kinase
LRYIGIIWLLPLHSTRRTKCTPISASKHALRLAKLNLSSLSTKTVILFLIEIFLCFFALFALHFTRRTQCTLISASKQFRQLAKRNLSSISTKTVISNLSEIFRRLYTLFTPFYAAIAVHSDFSVETSPATRKTQSFLDFEENSVISFLTEIF